MKKSREDLSEKIIELIDQLYFSFVEFKKDLKPIGLLKWNAASRIIGVNLNTLEKNARALFVLCSKSKASENNDCFCFLTPKEAGKKTPINESDAKKNHYSPVFKKYEELSEESVKQMIKKSKLEVSFISYSNEQNKVVALSIKDYLTNNKRIRFEAFVKKLVIDILNCISYAKAFIASREQSKELEKTKINYYSCNDKKYYRRLINSIGKVYSLFNQLYLGSPPKIKANVNKDEISSQQYINTNSSDEASSIDDTFPDVVTSSENKTSSWKDPEDETRYDHYLWNFFKISLEDKCFNKELDKFLQGEEQNDLVF